MLNDLEYLKAVPEPYAVLFEFYDLVKFDNSRGGEMILEYLDFMDWCGGAFKHFKIDSDLVPRKTNAENFDARFIELNGRIDDLNELRGMCGAFRLRGLSISKFGACIEIATESGHENSYISGV